nr:hypothetical protein [Tanacetum cinerariifolium]
VVGVGGLGVGGLWCLVTAAVVLVVTAVVRVVDHDVVGSGGGDSGEGGVGVGGSGGSGVRWRVGESGVDDQVDRETRNLFCFTGKIPPEKFSGGGVAAAAGGCRRWGEY